MAEAVDKDELTVEPLPDPVDLIERATAEVDLSLIDHMRSLSPLERVRACSRAARLLGRLRDGGDR